MDTVRSGEEPYMQFDKMSLRNYFPHEIEKLSVVHIYQTKTFDEIGHPVRGGLYDPLLGPTETFDRCETCHQQEMYCPGHVGHVKLDVPVFNPLLFSFTYNLLKGTCVQCHKFTCGSSNIAARIVMAQMRCFELGVPSAAEEIGQKMQASNQIDTLNKPDLDAYARSESNEAMLNAEIDKLICDITGKSISQLKADNRPCKNQVDMKKNIVKTFLREHLFRRKQKCPLCKGKNGTLRNDGGMSVLIDFSSKSAKVKDPKSRSDLSKNLADTEYDDEEYDEEEEEKKKMAEQSIDNELQSMGTTDVTKNSLDLQMRAVKNGECEKLAWRAAEVREHFRLMWKWDGRLLSRLFPMFSDTACGKLCPTDGLFSELIVVPATKFRPIRLFQGERFENPQTVTLRKLLESNETIKAIKLMMKGSKDSTLAEMIAARVQGRTINARMHNAYLQLQMRANAIFDQELDRSDAAARVPGIKQILEKKQGLFRMNMMGKRVNYACRSVITPDPYLDVDEIGIPEVFARKLTFTEPVNLVNVQQMRKLVKVGNTQHPGANFVRKHNGQTVLLNNPKKAESEGSAMAMRLQPADTNSLAPPMKVLRHLQKGDMVMMNRQPSLHKPSIMGHRARVLHGQRALRMNYAPCKAYNADFDGDEMNGHLVQTHIAQTEVRELANVGSNYLVPKDATPLLGLIQDHVVSGVYLTLRGRFLNKEDFMHLVLASFAETDQRIELPPPAMLLPRKLWSGKQVITAIIQNCIPPGKPMINLTGKAKTPLSCWKVRGHKAPDFNMSESEVVFRNGELLVGVLDKAHYGATQFGLIHCCFELYGHRVGARILSCFSRLFTTYLQYHGFTLGVADILVRDDANAERKKAVRESRTIGDDVVKSTFNLDENATPAQIKHVLASTYCNPRGIGQDVKMLDYGMKQGIAKYNDAINKACVPEGLIRSFPQNALQMMIQSGAKGSAVNAIQISCCLGQIELEGKRMAVTVAGRTLPSFRAFDPSPRAGGYIDQRFLTGINPQELFFHTMAGREGLIDTAVKTSRSGYLQRCIIKHLEGIKLHYDSTARDHDGSVIQFRYGEDGMDVCKSAFMQPKLFDFIEQNEEAVLMSSKPEGIRDRDMGVEDAEKHFSKIRKWKKKAAAGKGRARYTNGFVEFSKEREGTPKAQLLEEWAEMEAADRETYRKRAGKYCPSPVDEAHNPTRTLGALPEKLLDSIEKYIEDKREKLKRTLFWKGNRSLCEPGENVGLLAAQSIGEPSTQMTLNTFHFAGRGEMNVTLGIPRLREILMTASKSIATPSAQISVIPGTSRDRIDRIKQEMERVYLKNVLKKFTLDERINLADGKSWRRYALRLEILASSKREQQYRHLKRSKIMQEIEKRFIRTVGSVIDKAYKEVRDYQQIQHRKLREGNFNAGIIEEKDEPSQLKKRVDDGMSSDEEADGGRDADAGEARLNQRHRDDAAEYEGEDDDRANVEQPEEEEVVVSDAGEDEEGASGDDDEGESNRDRAERNRQSRNARIQSVVSSLDSVVEYRLDEKDEDRWCEVVFELPLWNKSKLDLCTIIDREVERFIVSQTTGIERCIEREETVKGENTIILQTQGVNLDAFFRHSDVLDVNSVQSNDLNLVLNQYGVEACSRSIVNEMNNVFAVYGIEVSKRHLSLTADYMTFTGKIEPFNRGAMAAAASPLQKMTFETTVAFLRDSLISGDDDHLSSPSARLVLGSLNRGGTGAFDLVLNKEASK